MLTTGHTTLPPFPVSKREFTVNFIFTYMKTDQKKDGAQDLTVSH